MSFSSIFKFTAPAPAPLPPEATLIHDALLLAVQSHLPGSAATLTVAVPPYTPKDRVAGESV
ncbi:MAG: hypothetical protein ACRD9Y_11035 [Blastocatellia bacterium]